MRGVLVNPYTRFIEEVIIKKSDINTIYDQMSWLSHKVEMVQVGFVLPSGDNMLVDEDGAIKPDRPVWKLNGMAFVGMGLFLGSDLKTQEWCSAKIPLADVQVYASWTTIVSTGMPHDVE